MASAPSRPPGLLWMLAFAAAAAGVLGLGLRGRFLNDGGPSRLLLVVQVSGAPGDLSPSEGRALGVLVKDLLELRGRRSVSLDPELPSSTGSLRAGEVLLLRAYRNGNFLGLQANLTSAQTPEEPRPLTCPAQDPARAMDWLLQQLPPPKGDPDGEGRLLPRDGQAFWALLEAMSLEQDGADPTRALDLAERIETHAPRCATTALLKGNVHYALALSSAKPSGQDLDQAQQGFEEALRRWPYHPRAALALVRLLSDTAHAKEALTLAAATHRAYPRVGPTCSAVLYASRFAGLMDVVDRSSLELEDFTMDPTRGQRLQLGQLYLGQWTAFERSLWTRPGEPYSAMIRFHLGYLRLLQGRKEEARTIFQDLERRAEGYPKFLRLGRVFRLALEGRRDQARKELSQLDEESTGLAVPDGEYTFNLAEAWALLGDQGAAVDAASRALGQGFACTRWYEQSPLLRDLQPLPRWQALVQTLRQREQRLARLFPVERFG